jgi:uncharacterized membrane protein HdeD (DUF308 family)
MMVLAGFAYWFWPIAGYAVASQIFGWLLVLAGVVQLCVATGPHHAGGWGWWLVGGIIDIFIGFMLVRNVLLSEAVLPYFLAFMFIFWGVEAFVRAGYRSSSMWWLSIINGILLCIIGYFFLEAGWFSDMIMVSFLTAIAFIYWGFTLAMTSYNLRPIER